MDYKLTARRWLSAFVVAAILAPAAYARQSPYDGHTFYTKLAPQAGDPPGDIKVLCVGTTLDLNCDGIVNLQDAILYADLCAVAAEGKGEGLLHSADTLQMRCRKAIGVADAFAALNNRPDLFESDGKSWLLMPSCGAAGGTPSEQLAAQAASSNEILCSGMATISAAIVQHVAGVLPNIPTDPNTVPPLPTNRPGNPDVYTPPTAEPPILTTPLPKVDPGQTFTPSPTPCTVPTPERSVMPGGDSPNVCCGELHFDGTNPCNIPVEVPSGLEGPGHSDEIICVSSTGTCQPPTPSTDPSNPTDTDVSDPFYCASANPCVPTCDDMPCSEGPFKSPATPGTICAGTCHFPYVDLDGDSDKPDDSWKLHDDGIYRYTPEFKPKEKKPTIYCGDLESSGTQSTLSANESGEDPKSCQPVDLVSGHKIEQETDLTVSLVGRDFSVIRNYSSNPHDLGVTSSGTFATGWGAFGFGWSSPLFEQMLVDGDDLVLMGARPNSFTRFERAGTEWRTAGPTQDVITSGTAPDRQGNPVDVYRVVSPGAGETLFYRTGSLAGRLLFERDEYGNARWFEYRWFGTGTPVFPRLYRVYLNGAGLDDAQALIEFGYTVFEQGVTPDDALAGRISRVVCFRFTETSGSRTAIETHRIDYTYKRSGDGLSDDCGTPGDLIQVTKFSRVDVGSPRRLVSNGRRYGPDYEYRTSVTQYRYHRAVQPDTGNERLDVVGGLHCLKSVFRSTQLEYYAELLNRNNAWLSGTAMSVRDAAQRLMLLPDSSLAVTRDNEQYHVYELASKIVGYSGTAIGDGNKVAVEYLQTGGCGCGGAVQSVRQEFERFAWTSADGHAGRTTAITESYRSEGTTPTWTPFRRRRVDSQRIGTSTAFYGVNSVLEALDPSGTPGRRWLTHYTYDPNTRTLGEVWTPSACRDLSYTSAGPGSAPTLTGSAASDGLINYYLYNSDKRLIEAGVRNAGGGSNTPVVTIGYDATRTHLPIQIEEIADTSGGANGKQTTTFQYTFYTGVYPNAVQSVRTIVEAERPEENGPSGAGVAYSTLTLLDQQGQAVWRAAADGALTRRDYDPRTGRVSGVVANADPAGLGALSGLYSDWASTYGLSTIYAGPTLSYTLERDEQGRITRTISPGPDGPVSQEWVFGYRRIDEPGLNERSGIPYAFYGILPPTWSGSTSGSAGPITLVWTNVGGGTVQAGRFETVASAPLDRADIPALLTATPGSDPLAGYLGDEAYRQLMRFSLSNQVVSATAWHDIGGHLGRPQDDRSYTASCEYDAIGRRVKVVSTTGDISKFDHESATGRVIAEYHGTADNNLQLVSSYYYDSGGTTTQGVGNGNLTLTVLQTGETSPNDTRSRKYAYDFRDRLQSIQNPLPPHQFFVYDNLGRITESADFTGSAPTAIDSPGRGSYARQYFSQRGLPYRSAVAINPSDLGAGFIESHRWFDSVGRAIASTGPDSPTLKVRYDRLGRVSIGFVTDRGGDAAPGSGSYADAASLAGDTVLEQTEYQYTDADYLSFVRHLVHPHDAATGQGRLAHPDDPACGESTGPGIATYTGYRYDGAGRLVRTVEFGTNKAPDAADRLGDSFTNAPAPVWSSTGALPNFDTPGFDHALVSAVSYNARGLVDDVVDPKGRHARTLYDDLDRVIAHVENAVGGAGSGVGVAWDTAKGRWAVTGVGANDPVDQNRVTSYAHVRITEGSETTWRMRQAAHFPPGSMGQAGTDAQVTEVVYGVGAGTFAGNYGSLINAGLPREVRFPDETTGEPGTSDQYKVRYAYNRLGELLAAQDQNGTVHRYLRDAFGRVVSDLATFPQGSEVDQTRTEVEVAFDTLGRVSDVRSLNPSQTVLDHVRYSYNGLGMLEDLTQDPDSSIDSNGSTEPARVVHYAYQIANIANGNHARAASMRYPEVPGVTPTTRSTLSFLYGVDASGSQLVNDAIGRVNAISLQDTVYDAQGQGQANPPVTLAEYSFVGLAAASHADLADAGVQLDRTIDSTGRRNYGVSPTQTVGAYPGWDRFGRVKRNTWVNTSYDTAQDAQGAWGPNRREYSSLSYLYDKVGNPIARKNEQLGAGYDAGSGDRWPDRDWKFGYDGLDRLVQAQRGVISGPMTGGLPDTTLARAPGSQKWELDALGNWNRFAIDFNNNNPGDPEPTFDQSPSEFQDRAQAGGHNMANEVAGLPAIAAAPAASPYAAAGSGFAYDHNGNRTAGGWDYPSGQTSPPAVEGLRFKYTYDAWNRLVKIDRAPYAAAGGVGTYAPIAEYTYNGLNWRTAKHTIGGVGGAGNQTLADDAAPVLREKRLFWYDAAWRAIAEDVDDDTTDGAAIAGLPNVSGTDRHIQQVFGLRGINDAIYRREDRATFHAEVADNPNTPENEHQPAHTDPPDGRFDPIGSGTADMAVYQLADPQGSVVAVLADAPAVNPRLVDEVEYEPYGRARRTAQGDFNHSGSITPQDNYDFLNAYFAAAPAGDADDGGTTTTDDVYAFLGEYLGGDTTPSDRISGWSVFGIIDNPYGYCGYYADQETAAAKVLGPGGGALYSVRFRVYDPIAGRWLTRDPAGFVDGMNLYEYCGGQSARCVDPTGLGKIAWLVRGIKSGWKYVSHKAAKKALKHGDDVLIRAETKRAAKSKARNLAKHEFGDKVAHHTPHDPGQMPHFQHKNGGHGHVFYEQGSKAGAVTLAAAGAESATTDAEASQGDESQADNPHTQPSEESDPSDEGSSTSAEPSYGENIQSGAEVVEEVATAKGLLGDHWYSSLIDLFNPVSDFVDIAKTAGEIITVVSSTSDEEDGSGEPPPRDQISRPPGPGGRSCE